MATPLRATDPVIAPLVAAFNDLKAQVGAGSAFHMDKSEKTVTSANASSLATSLTLVNELTTVYAFHAADLLAHKAAGNALAATTPCTTLAQAITRANDIKAKFNLHCAATAQHYTADETNTTSATDAADQSSLNTLLNELKADINAHMASGPAAKSLRLVSA